MLQKSVKVKSSLKRFAKEKLLLVESKSTKLRNVKLLQHFIQKTVEFINK